MRHSHYVYTAAALTSVLAFEGSALGETVTPAMGGLTVAATWRAQPAAIEQGGATTFKLSLRAAGGEGVSGISFDDSIFTFSSGSAGSAPTSADMILNATARSAGSTANAMLAPLQVTYFEEGIYDASVHTSSAGVSWMAGGVEQTGTYSLDLGTKVSVGGAGGSAPNLQSVSVPLLIGVGESFAFSALADSGLMGSLTYQWDFDFDGTFSSDSQQQAPSYAYDTAGVHTGMLHVLGEDGYVVPLQFTVNAVNELGAPVPLPAAVWGGLGLMAAFGVIRAFAASRRVAAASGN